MQSNPQLSVVKILIIEDNPGDVELTRRALESSKLHNELIVAPDGQTALNLLKAVGTPQDLPDLILLDLNLPGLSGLEILAALKGQTPWARIPVVILTSSQAEMDIAKSYDLHANCYVTKPLNFEHFIEVVQSIKEFWFTMVRLPGKA